MFFNAVAREGSNVTDIQCWFWAFEISPDPLDLLMIIWTVDDEIPEFLASVGWEMFLNWQFLLTRLFTKWWPSPHPCLWTTEPYGDAPFTPNHDTHLFPINLFTCRKLQVFFEHSSTFPLFCCPCPRFFFKRVAGIKFKMSEYLQKKKNNSLSVWTLNILSL